MTDRPRLLAAEMLTALRAWWKAYLDEHVPKEYHGMVTAYVVSEMAKGLSRKRKE